MKPLFLWKLVVLTWWMVAFYVVAVIENGSIAFQTFQDYTNLHCQTLHVSVCNTDSNLLGVVTDPMDVMACFFQGWPDSAGVNFHCIQP